jgi:hypothetical protein
VERGARLDRSGRYRYRLWRIWAPEHARVAFVGLNPSTADATVDDPTLRRCMGFARAWGFGGLELVNLYGFRATRPRDLWAASERVGPQNARHHRAVFRACREVVVCWGRHGDKEGQGSALLSWLYRKGHTPMCLGLNADGTPKHPLYIPNGTPRMVCPKPVSI